MGKMHDCSADTRTREGRPGKKLLEILIYYTSTLRNISDSTI